MTLNGKHDEGDEGFMKRIYTHFVNMNNKATHRGWENSGASSLMFAILTRTVAVPE